MPRLWRGEYSAGGYAQENLSPTLQAWGGSNALAKKHEEEMKKLRNSARSSMRKELEMVIQRLRSFDKDRADLDEMVDLSAGVRGLVAEYEALAIPVPDWVGEAVESVRLEVKSRRRDALAKALKDAKARKSALKSAEEKKQDLDEEIKKLEGLLG